MAVRFADVVLDVEAMRLERAGHEVAVEPQVFDVLAYLVAHRERLVPKNELLDEVWGDRFVSESALTSRIKSARRAIGDNGRDQRLIRTVHGRGFRFVGEVADGAGGSVDRPPPQGDASSPPAAAHQLVDRIRAGRGLVIELIGSPAGARADAVEEILQIGDRQGLLVGHGSAGELRPLAGVVGALDEWVSRRPELLTDIPVGCADELRRVLHGEPAESRQRLHLSCRELLAAGARAGGALLAVSDVHLGDLATVDLLEDLARSTRRLAVGLVVSHRPGAELATESVSVQVTGDETATEAVPAGIRAALARAAVLGDRFDQDEFEAAAGLDTDEAQRAIDVAISSGVVVQLGDAYQFAEDDLAARLAAEVAGPARAGIHGSVADRLVALGAPSARIADRLAAGGLVQEAAAFQVDAATVAAAAQMHTEVLRHTSAVGQVADPAVRFRLLELRAAAAVASGRPDGIGLYREALGLAPPERVTPLRVRLTKAFIVSGDLEGATEMLKGIEPTGESDDAEILLSTGLLAYFRGDLAEAEELSAQARELAVASGASRSLLDVISLQGMIAHSRGEWFDRIRRELRFSAESPELASTLFDSHVCVSQYLLYGPTDHDELIRLAGGLRATGERLGLPRAVGFALTLAGEVHLLAGDLTSAREDLTESVRVHAEIGADTGRAHAMQRLADVELADGNRQAAEQICRQSIPLARWSPLSNHLLQRAYGTLIAAAPDSTAAMAAVEDARATLDSAASCAFCEVMIAVPAAMAYAEAGRFDEAATQIDLADRCASLWDGTAWAAAVLEARAVLARAQGDEDEAGRLFGDAATRFSEAGQVLDADRCLEARDG